MGPCYKSEGYGGQVEMLKFLTVGAIVLAFAGPETLTLACKGETTTYQQGARPEPIALGLVIDFTKRTIKSFPLAGEIEITQITASAIYFHKSAASSVFDGRIDRMSGQLLGIESDDVIGYCFPRRWPADRERRAAIIGDWLQTEARFLA